MFTPLCEIICFDSLHLDFWEINLYNSKVMTRFANTHARTHTHPGDNAQHVAGCHKCFMGVFYYVRFAPFLQAYLEAEMIKK